MNRERHLLSAETTDPEFIRGILAGLPVATAIETAPGFVAITRLRVIEAGLDSLAVSRWLQDFGGYGAVAYLRPMGDRMSNAEVRPALHPVSYFAVPLDALQQRQASAGDGDAAAGAAVA
jgi:hypothetical protein